MLLRQAGVPITHLVLDINVTAEEVAWARASRKKQSFHLPASPRLCPFPPVEITPDSQIVKLVTKEVSAEAKNLGEEECPGSEKADP